MRACFINNLRENENFFSRMRNKRLPTLKKRKDTYVIKIRDGRKQTFNFTFRWLGCRKKLPQCLKIVFRKLHVISSFKIA